MKPGTIIFAFVLLAAFSLQGLAQGVTETEARTLLAEVDKAIPRKDIDAIAGALSENVVLEITIVAGGQSQSATYDKAEYVKGLLDSWAQVTDYQYQRSNQTIVMSGQKAVATADVVESFVLQGQGFASRTRAVTTIERVGEVPLITKVVGTTSMEQSARM